MPARDIKENNDLISGTDALKEAPQKTMRYAFKTKGNQKYNGMK